MSASRAKFWCYFAYSLMAVSIVLPGCKEPLPDARDINTELVGAWVMEREETLRQQRKMYKDAGVLKINQDVFDFQRNFATVHFNLELNGDASFTCSMGDMFRSGEYSGHWISDAHNNVEMVQTHENGKPKRDRMEGRFDGRNLQMNHKQEDLSIPWVFIRRSDLE